MELIEIECEHCKTYFFTKNETGLHNCPKCNGKNERYIFSDKIEKVYIGLIADMYEDIKKIFIKNKILSVSNIGIIELIEKSIINNEIEKEKNVGEINN